MIYFPNGDEEIGLIKFIARYQYLHIQDAKCFFSSNRYYRNRIKNLIDKRFIKKVNSFLVLDEIGIEYVKQFNFQYNKRNRNKKYILRISILSNIAAFYNNCELVKFIPSFEIKDKEVFTVTGRKFIGILDINGMEYLSYLISKEHDSKYISSVAFDIQKEITYKNFIILVNDISRINLDDFAFGKNQILIIEDNEINREKIKYLHSIKWREIIDKCYNGIYLAKYNFCEYTNYKDIYINTFYFIDTEKINRFKYFINESSNKRAYIICNKELEMKLRKELPNANYCVVDLEKYIRKERRYYS